MKGFFLNCSGNTFDADIFSGKKKIETRTRNMLSKLNHERVAVIKTGKGKPVVIGTVTINGWCYPCKPIWDSLQRKAACIEPGSKYDCETGKYCYFLENPIPCDPYPVPANAVRHGRSWCEW